MCLDGQRVDTGTRIDPTRCANYIDIQELSILIQIIFIYKRDKNVQYLFRFFIWFFKSKEENNNLIFVFSLDKEHSKPLIRYL